MNKNEVYLKHLIKSHQIFALKMTCSKKDVFALLCTDCQFLEVYLIET